ncbi:MAG: cytotoxic translational repressor of toxin-antitoxin stability system [Desulfovibrio sp. S3730MH75]|nr:MAG: cytotoxic translational repressor of toxin-antitoxin stability system [Desulfovibrio sp. S3730MH75]
MKWTTNMTAKVRKQMGKLPKKYVKIFEALLDELTKIGPVRSSWPNYGKIKGKSESYHCHLNKGKPRYVAVWTVVDNEIKIIEVRYVGTHEKTDYKRIC